MPLSETMNLVASLQDRLKNEGRRTGIHYASLLEQFALSRFFARLAQSDYADRAQRGPCAAGSVDHF